jgi:hypothetical protein
MKSRLERGQIGDVRTEGDIMVRAAGSTRSSHATALRPRLAA